MSCPKCGEDCRCVQPRSYLARALQLAEIDEYDPSEEQFASSLAGREQPEEAEPALQELSSGTLESARQRYAPVLPDIAVETPESDLLLTSPQNPEAWKDEVTSRIESYKARRRRSLGDESMSFNFESTAGNHVFLRPEREPEPDPVVAEEPTPPWYSAQLYATAPDVADFASEPVETEPEDGEASPYSDIPSQLPISLSSPPEIAKLIFFPKPPMMEEPVRDQLAEPVFDVPRIVEANEAAPVTVPLADITLQPDVTDDCVPFIEPMLELPNPVAPIPQRVFAELVDVLLILFATGIFGMIVARIGGNIVLTDTHTIAGLLVLVPAAFWGVYKYLFLVYGTKTIGMQLTRLRLVDFDGASPARSPRRYRALSMLISAFPLGLGLLWSFVDTESLCWHDRISRTYLTGK